MELNQRSISWRMETGFILCLLLVALILSLIYASSYSVLLLMLSLVQLSLVQYRPTNTIVITETGIACLGKTDTLWTFDWDEVESLAPSRRERVKCLELKVKSHRHMEILAYRQYENRLYFQLDKKAKKTLAQYAPAHLSEGL